jgi:hypothetical protein
MPEGDFIVFEPFEVEADTVIPPAFGVLMPVPPWPPAAPPPFPPLVPPAPPAPCASAVPAKASRNAEQTATFLAAFMIASLSNTDATLDQGAAWPRTKRLV